LRYYADGSKVMVRDPGLGDWCVADLGGPALAQRVVNTLNDIERLSHVRDRIRGGG
jgi:hypothetical protein